MQTPRKYTFCCLILLNTTAYATQDIDDLMQLSPAELADISVSIASGSARSVSHSAAVTSVITAEQITAMGATELHEILETVPGIHVTIQPVTGDYNYTMRGIRNVTNAEVLLLMNGTRYSLPYQGSHMAGMIIPVENIQRVEVIRGPGSAVYGADAFAGVINIVTKKAADIDGITVGARGGNADTKSSWGQYGGKWQGWDVATSLQYSHNGVANDRIIGADFQTTLDMALGTQASLASGAMQTQNERWNGHLNLQRKHWDLSFWAFNESDAGFRAGTGGALDKKGSVDGANYLADARYSTEDAIENWEFQAHASFLHADIDANIYNLPAGTRAPIGADGNITLKQPLIRLVNFPDGMRFVAGFKNTVPSFEMTSIYKGFRNHQIRLITGFRYEELNTKEARNYGPGVLDGNNLNVSTAMIDLNNSPNTFLTDHHRDIWSAALQDEWQFAEYWHLTTGIRYDKYSDFGTTVNPRVALVWDISSQLTSKLLYGQAYRAPSFLEQYQKNNPLFIGNPGLQPETIETTELAFDYRPTKNLRTAVNLYYFEIKNLISNPFSQQDMVLTETNTRGQKGYGSEFEWDWKFLENWNLRGNYAWQNGRDQTTQTRVTDVPIHHVYSALAWNFMPKWQIQTQVNWVGQRLTFANDPRPALNDYQTLDLTLNARKLMGNLDLTASVRNLFNAQGKEPSILAYPSNLPISTQSFYFEANLHF